MYQCEFFSIHELVHPSFFKTYSKKILWSRFNPEYLRVLDQLRREFGPIVINGNFAGQKFTESGARPHTTSTGAALSMHKLWAAFDLKFKNEFPEDVQAFIMAKPENYAPITRMEDAGYTKTWLHIDFGNPKNNDEIYIFKP